MVKLNKIYTKTGDKGKTSLVSGKRVSKDNIRIRAYGTIDELNSILGVVKHHVSKKLIKIVSEIQNDLFDLGADLATPISKSARFHLYELPRTKLKDLKPQLISLINLSQVLILLYCLVAQSVRHIYTMREP